MLKGKMGFLLSAFLFATICSALPTNLENKSGEVLSAQWEAFKAKYGKHYSSTEEELHRRTIWESSLKKIEEHNALHQRGLKTYQINGANEFADMTYEEFSAKMLMPPRKKPAGYENMTKNAIPFKSTRYASVPSSVDWRSSSGVVAPIKHQYSCGSCYAFAGVSTVESHWRLYSGRTNTVIPLSEQEIVDCSRPQGNAGCNGGNEDNVYDYVRSHGRISKASSYPYEAKEVSCRAPTNDDSFGASIRGYVRTLQMNEDQMKEAVATKGPVAVYIYASPAFKQFSGDGIFDGPDCPDRSVNHGVVVVGYGTLNGVDYWIVRNSWGTYWGDGGYVKMRRGQNTCAIAQWGCYYPLI